MSASLTENFRLFNVKNFLNSVSNNFITQIGSGSTYNNVYLFVARVKDWDNPSSPPPPINNYRYYSDIYDQIISLKKLTSSNFLPVIKRVNWTSGTTYTMYRPDYTPTGNLEEIGSGNINLKYPPKTTSSGYQNLYEDSKFYVINENYQVYKCLNNGQSPVYPNGAPSTVAPTGNSTSPIRTSDGYTWKYLYSIPPQFVVNFVTDDYIPVPLEGTQFSPETSVKTSAEQYDGSVEAAIVISSGSEYTDQTKILNILGDGVGATVSVEVSGSKIQSATIVNRGSGYTFGKVNLSELGEDGVDGEIEIVVSPKYGHGYSPFDELGGFRIMISSKISYNEFPQDISYRQIGLLLNPFDFGTSQVSTGSNLSGTKSVTFSSISPPNSIFTSGETINQTVGTGKTAYGVAVSWNSSTKTLQYYQDQYDGIGSGNSIIPFSGSSSITSLGSNPVTGIGSTDYTSASIIKNSGKILYLDNREVINRSPNQTEDIKIVVEF